MLKNSVKPLSMAVRMNLLAAAVAVSAPASGQVIEEVIVTAQKRLENMQETPVSITALNENLLEKMGIQNTEGLLGSVPGVGGIISPGARGALNISIRGVSAGAAANLSLDPAVGTYIDGVYVGKQLASAMDVAEIQQMEILRGPQGTLYGRNSTAGAVNIVTRKPTGEFGVRVKGTVGNYDLWSVKTNIDLPSVGTVGEGLGEFSASIGFQNRQRDGLYENYSGGHDFDSIDRENWRAVIGWSPVESVQAYYTYEKSELDEISPMQQVTGFTPLDANGTNRLAALKGVLAGAQGMALMPGADPRITSRWIPSLQKTIRDYEGVLAQGDKRADGGFAEFAPVAQNEVEGHSFSIEFTPRESELLGDYTLKSITAVRELETYVFGDMDTFDSSLDANGVGSYNDLVHLTLAGMYGAEFDAFGTFSGAFANGVWAGIDSVGAYHSRQDTTSEYQQISQEFQMIGSKGALDYTLGLFWFEDRSEYDRRAVFSAPLAGTPIERYKNTAEAFAIFGQTTYRMMDDRLALTFGARYTEEEKTIKWDIAENVTPFGAAPAMYAEDDENFYNFSYTATVAYAFTDTLNGYLRNSTAYRSGGFNGEVFGNSFDEETIEQWELGLKADWLDGRLRTNASLYTYKFEDIQVSKIETVNDRATTSIENAGEAERWGGELELTYMPVEDLVVTASYSYINGDFEEFPDVCNGSNCIDGAKSAHRSGSPSNQATLAFDYTLARFSFGDLNAYLQGSWQDSSHEVALRSAVLGGQPYVYPNTKSDERTLINAKLGLTNIQTKNGEMSVTLWVNNLTDHDYSTYAINFGQLGIISQQYGERRTYGLDFEYRFGD